jgi:hypothetical protein
MGVSVSNLFIPHSASKIPTYRYSDSVLSDWGLGLWFLWVSKALRSLSKVPLPRLNAGENLRLRPLEVGTDRREFEFPSQQN